MVQTRACSKFRFAVCLTPTTTSFMETKAMQSKSSQLQWVTKFVSKIISIREGVTEVRVGDRAAVSLDGYPDRPLFVIGLTMDGGYAEYAIAAAEMLVLVPDSVSDEHASAVSDFLTTAYHGIIEAGEVKAGETVVIVGLVSVEGAGLQIACMCVSATVYGFDINTSKFDAAVTNGAKACFAKLEDAGDVVFDKIIDFVGLNSTMSAALGKIAYRDRIVIVSIGGIELTVSTFTIIWNKV